VKFFSTERQALLYPRKVANEADLIKLMAPVAFEIFLKWHEEFVVTRTNFIKVASCSQMTRAIKPEVLCRNK